jgi:hypothetical protein
LEGRPTDDPWQPGEGWVLMIDQGVNVWGAEIGTQVTLIVRPAPMRGTWWLSDGRLLTWGDDGHLSIWRLQ